MSGRILRATVLCAAMGLCLGCADTNQETVEPKDPSLVVTPDGTMALREAMDTARFGISLTVPSTAELQISVTASKPEKVVISDAQINGYFYPNAKNVEVYCADDFVNDGDDEVELEFTVTSDDARYDGMKVTKTLICRENDQVQVSTVQDDFCPNNPNKTQPGICGCDVDDSPENTAELVNGYAKCLMRFAPEAEDDGDYTLSILEPDDELLTELGDSQLFAVALSEKPAADVIVPIQSSDETEGTTDVNELVFTPDNWNDPQFVTVTGMDDDLSDGDVEFSVFIGPATSDDANFDGLSAEPITFINMDDEEVLPDIVLSTTEYSVHEGGASADLYIKLAKAPVDAQNGEDVEVNVRITSSDTSELIVSNDTLTFNAENWDVPQIALIRAFKDNNRDGNKTVQLSITSDSNENCNNRVCYNDREYQNVEVTIVDADALSAAEAAKKVAKIRIMAANITSGSAQSYDPGEGIHIFKAAKPDIVLIQEFNYKKNTIASFVKSTFGDEFSYHRGKGDIPNGIISRYPIIQSGSWESNRVQNREWDWAVIDIPGDRDLLAVSVHLHTSDNAMEMGPLRGRIDKKMASDKKDYYVVIGGDFNQPKWNSIRSNFASLFSVGKSYSDWPMDQLGQITTNAKRAKQYDYLLCTPDFCKYETPVVIGEHSYPKGHVIDSRVYNKKGELKTFSPVQAKDSAATNMQHMAVIRDFEYRYAD